MEFGAKEIIIVIGALVFIAIILDVIKRMRASRYENIRMSKKKQPTFSDDDFDEYGSELPGGGSRVVGYREVPDEIIASPTEVVSSSRVTDTFVKATADQEPELEQPVIEEPEVEPVIEAEQQELEQSEPIPTETIKKAAKTKPDTPQASLDLGDEPKDLILVVHLMAKSQQQFMGEPLRDALLDAGLRYGSMKIFHRHTKNTGAGPVIFSVANSVNPGTFDLDAMDEFTTPGITFLFNVDDVENPMDCFDLLVETVKFLAQSLDGELKDETRSVLTAQTIEHYRTQITDHLRHKRTGVA